jgi:hypothetical protein
LKVMTGWSPAGIGPLVQINGRILWINLATAQPCQPSDKRAQ